MANIKKVLDKDGNQIFPITTTNGVLNPDAQETLESRLQIIEERLPSSGTTSERPSLGQDMAGFIYFDKTLGKSICWSGTSWINMDGSALS